MTKAELQTSMESITGWVSTLYETIDKSIQDEQSVVIKILGRWEVEYIANDGNTYQQTIRWVEDKVLDEAKYRGTPPVFQPSASQTAQNQVALIAYFNSKAAWKAYTIENINAEQNFAVLTVILKDTSNKFYSQRVIVFDQAGLTDKDIEKDDYIPV